MKYLKLFEGFEEKPKSIVVEITPKFEEKMSEFENAHTGAKGFTRVAQDIGLIDKDRIELDGDRYVRVATLPFDIGKDIQQYYWASYEPDNNEIYVCLSATSAEETKRLNGILFDKDTIHKGQIERLFPNNFHAGFYCKFNNGFKVGEEDDRGYFKIVEVK